MHISRQQLKTLLSDLGDVLHVVPISGGSISQAYRVTLQTLAGDSCELFAKRNSPDFLGNFRCEARGLEQLAAVGTIRVPKAFKVACVLGSAWIVTEWIETFDASSLGDGTLAHLFYERFGEQLALMHRKSSCDQIGLEHDNYLGAAAQINTRESDWVAFVRKHRLGFQLRWAIEQGLAEGKLQQDIERIIERLPELLDGHEPSSSLVHGDLWSGNYLCDAHGQPAIFDPAIYFGCREAEFGMLKLFGNCPPQFYAAYQRQYPLPTGWERRTDIYQLVHLLNHLNMFGASYHLACSNLAKRILMA